MGYAELAAAEFSAENVGGVDIGHRPAEDAAGAGGERAAGRRRRIGGDDVDGGLSSAAAGLGVWGIAAVGVGAAVAHFCIGIFMLRLWSQNCLRRERETMDI